MNLLCLKIPLIKLKEDLDYTVVLEETRIQNYNHSILLPARTIILSPAKTLIRDYDWEEKEFNISFVQEDLKKEYDNLSFRNKTINTGLLQEHSIISEILSTTPYHYDKDSISESLHLIKLTKSVSMIEEMVPHTMLADFALLKKSVEKIRPLRSSLNLASLKKGFAFSGPDVVAAKSGFFVKNWMDKGKYEFGNCFYSLGNLAGIYLKLSELWLRA